MSSSKASSGLKRKSETLSDMLTLLKRLAADPFGKEIVAQEWRDEILKARKALFGKVSKKILFHSPKKQRTGNFLRATSSSVASLSPEKSNLSPEKSNLSPNKSPLRPCKQVGSSDSQNRQLRRSNRILLKLNSDSPKKPIPTGPLFQTDVPDWIGPPTEDFLQDYNESNDSRWLGTQLWPIEGDDRLSSEELVGKGRPDLCGCNRPGSERCVRLHVNSARRHLKSDLGPAFSGFGFNEMGEEVSKSWTPAEQMKFDTFVRRNPSSEGKSFMEAAYRYFTSKGRQGVVSFYFNVFVLRWMSILSRQGSGRVDSDYDGHS